MNQKSSRAINSRRNNNKNQRRAIKIYEWIKQNQAKTRQKARQRKKKKKSINKKASKISKQNENHK